MSKYFKTTIVDAIQFTGYNQEEILNFTDNLLYKHPIYSEMIHKDTSEVLHVGGYVVKDGNTLKIVRNIDFEKDYKQL